MNKRCYFAHPKGYYGTSLERDVIERLHREGFDVENPSLPEHQVACRKMDRPMAYFEDMIASCDALCFIRFDDGTIGAGCAAEIEIAEKLGQDILEFSDGQILHHRGVISGIRLDIAATQAANKKMIEARQTR